MKRFPGQLVLQGKKGPKLFLYCAYILYFSVAVTELIMIVLLIICRSFSWLPWPLCLEIKLSSITQQHLGQKFYFSTWYYWPSVWSGPPVAVFDVGLFKEKVIASFVFFFCDFEFLFNPYQNHSTTILKAIYNQMTSNTVSAECTAG